MASPKHSVNRRKFSRTPLDLDDLTSASSFSGIRDVIEGHFGKPDSPSATPPVLETDPTRLQYVWEPKEAPVSVRLSVELIERLETESLEIFRAITNRGSEIGGILLGQVAPGESLTVVVEDYEPIPCAYSLGPTYRLSEGEQESLRDAIARRRAAGELTVGFFRSNTRPTLALTEEDLSLFYGYFPEERNIFLLAKPFSRRPSRGAIFVREGRKLRQESSYLEFPFSRSELEKSGALQPAIRVVRQTEPAGAASHDGRVMIEPSAATPSGPGPQEPAAALGAKAEPPLPVSARVETSPGPAALREPVRTTIGTGIVVKVKSSIEPAGEAKIEPAAPPATWAKIEPRVPPKPVAESAPVFRRAPEPEPRVELPPEPVTRFRDRVQPVTKSDAQVVAPAAPPRVELPPEPVTKPRDRVQPVIKSDALVVAPASPAVKVSAETEPAPAPAAHFDGFQFGTATAAPARRSWLLRAAAVVVVGGIGLLAVLWNGSGKQSKTVAPASAVRPEPARLELRVEGTASGLLIQWDPLVPAISAARGGKLSIVEGGVPSSINLSSDDLKKGRYIHKPRADDLTLRLELDQPPGGQNVFGLARVLGAIRMLPPAKRR
jgi:hypothetical protein